MEPESGWHDLPSHLNDDQLVVADRYEVMKRWEAPLMERMAALLCETIERTRIVEVGFGMGLSANAIQSIGVESHTIIEPHPDMYDELVRWADAAPDSDIRPVNDYWQNQIDLFVDADGIFFDTYATSAAEVVIENISFLIEASMKLRDGAAVAVFWIHPTLDEAQQEILYRHFSRVLIEKVEVHPGSTRVEPLARLGFLLALVAIK